ncbi:MAG: hypothetical protein ACMUHU_03845, partial [Thermoplasmatota archaeon]
MLRRNGPVIVFLLLVTLCSAPGISSGIPETEPNDNFFEAEVVGPGVINGTVNSSPVVDQDYFNITVPSGKDLFVQLEKMDSGTRSISVQGYDHQRKIMGVSLSVASQFQTDSTIWYNKDIVSRAVYLSVGGTGSYDLTLQIRNYTTDGDDSFDTATRMMEGNYSGTVGYIPYHDSDQDFYRFDVPPDSDVILVTEKTDSNGEDLRFSWFGEKRHYEGSYTFRNPREYEDKTFYNSGETKVLKYLMVSGEGDYNISMRIRTYPRDGDDTFETARTLIKGRTTGDVETYDEHDDDVDYYKTVVPPMNDIFVTLGKNGTEGSSIALYFYTQHREPIQGTLRVDYAGHNRSTTWYYSGEGVTWFYLVVKGSGSYIIDLDLAAYEVDGNDDFSSAKMIDEGNFNDSVDKDPAHGDDVDFFITEIPPYHELRITLEALSVITYEIRLNTYTMSRQNYGLYLEVEKKGDLASKATYNPGPTAISIYLY